MKKFLWMTLAVLLVVSMAVLSAAADTGYVLNVELTDVDIEKDENGESYVYSITYDVALTANGEVVAPTGEPVTFLLPVPKTMAVGSNLNVYRNGEFHASTTVEEIDGGKCVQITVSEFGTFAITMDHMHDFVAETVTAPTCTEGGYTTYVCSSCDKSYISDKVEALGHSYETTVTPATCTTTGYTTYICHCGDSYTGDVVSAKGHDYKTVVTAPTSTTVGYTTYICDCGDSYVDDYVSALGSTVILADRAGSTPQTGGGDYFGQRFDIGNDTLKQLVITKLATYMDSVNTWEIKFWQWDSNQPITVNSTPIYTKTGSNHIDSTDFIIDIPDSITLTGEIYYEIYYRSGNTGFAGWDALGSHHDSLHTYVNGNEVNTHIASYIKINPSDETDVPETDAPSDGLNVKQEDLKEIMQNVFDGTVSLKETVMFIDKNTTKNLLFPINSIVSVTSYDGKTTYLEGRDYEIVNGQLKITAGSTMPAITSAVYYNYTSPYPDVIFQTKNPSTNQTVNTYWGESMMKQWQVSVTYTHDDNWSGFEQQTQYEVYKDFVQKLANGEDVTVMFYGDSITWGANSTFAEGVQPRQGAYAMLFTEALADLFGYTITYVNTAVGGWTSTDGVTYFDEHIKSQFNTYGCDLFVVAFGMNDSGMYASSTKSNVKSIIDKMYQLNSKASVMIVSTMTPHTGSNWDSNNIKNQETQLISLASTYQSSGKAVAVAQVNSVSKAIQERKSFNDYAGNNINHPNDWFYRVYAQTLLQTLIGYENMD